MIKSFGDKECEKIWNGIRSKKLPNEIQDVARRKLRIINNAQDVNDLRIPPANKLEKLKGVCKNTIVFGLTINGESSSNGSIMMLTK
jgi:proteic killer suppression protein